jgi:hypothetical protein
MLVLSGVALIWFPDDNSLGIETRNSVQSDIVIKISENNIVHFVGLSVLNWL